MNSTIVRKTPVKFNILANPRRRWYLAAFRKPGTQTSRTSQPLAARPFIVIAVAVLVVFGQTLRFGLTHSDDDELVAPEASPPSAASSFTTPYLDTYYRPLVSLSIAADRAAGEGAPWSFHLTNLLLHLSASLLLYALVMRLGAEPLPALAASLFFAVNPAAVQAVGWIPGRNDGLMALFSLASFALLVGAGTKGGAVRPLLHLALYACALFSKESALLLPLILGAYLFTAGRRREILQYAAGWTIVIAAWFVLRTRALAGSGASLAPSSPWAAIRSMTELLGKIFFPLRLSGLASFDTPTLLAGAAALAALAFIVPIARRRNPAALAAAIWTFLLLLPGVLLHAPGAERKFDYLECRAYAPLLGVAIIAAFALRSEWLAPRIGAAVAAALLIAYGLAAFSALGQYRDPLAHWTRVAETADRSAEASFNLGFVIHSVYNDPAAAAGWYRKAIALDSSVSMYHDNLGFALCDRGRYGDAEEEYRRAIALDSTDPFPRAHLGRAFLLGGDTGSAERWSVDALRLDPRSTDALTTLVNIAAARRDSAAERFYRIRLDAAHGR